MFEQRDTAQIPSCRIATQEQCVLLSVSGLLRDDGAATTPKSSKTKKNTYMKNSASGRSDRSERASRRHALQKQPASPIILHTLGLRSFEHDISRGEVAILYHATRRDGFVLVRLGREQRPSSKQRSVQRSRTSTAMEGTNRTRGAYTLRENHFLVVFPAQFGRPS